MRLKYSGKTESGGDAGEGGSCETRQAIIEAARSRFLHYGYKKTTIDEIAADAGVGKGTVYLYFDGKEEILLTIARQVKRNVTEQMRALAASLATPEEKLRRMMHAAILSVHDACNATAHGVELVDEMVRPNLMRCGSEERQAQLGILADVLREGVRRGDFSLVNGDADEAARHLMLAMVSFFPPYANPCYGEMTCRMHLQTRVSAMLDFLMNGLKSR